MDSASMLNSHAVAGRARSRSQCHAPGEGNRTNSGGEINARESRQCGLFVISLDFEQLWGVRHMPQVSRYLPRLRGTGSAIRSMLETFADYGIHATWAVVGFLFAENGLRLREHLPGLRPQYVDGRLSPYSDLPPVGSRETPDCIFFAPTLIKQIQRSAHQEIGTHTLSHYYCLEPGQDFDTFKADLKGAVALAQTFGIQLRSLVFPKNQCRNECLDICAELGIIAYRGNPGSWLYRADEDRKKQTPVRRFGRLLDSYLPISSALSEALPLAAGQLPINVPGSRFLRAYMPALRAFEPLRLLRIKREMTFAARNGRLYHLWWHPHDFGVNTSANLRFLKGVLDHFRTLSTTYGFQSVNMAEAAEECLRRADTGGLAKPPSVLGIGQ